MASPRVSICIPAIEAERSLPHALTTIKAQTLASWELIVVEDGSRDRCEELVLAFAATVPQPVRYFSQPKNWGPSATRNTCAAIARGEWLALLDAHDYWSPDHLQVSFACARWHDAAIVHGGSTAFASDTGKILAVHTPSPAALRDFPRALFRGDYHIPTSTVMLRRSIWERLGGFDPAFRHGGGREMWLRCARAGVPFTYSGHATSFHRQQTALPAPRAAAIALAHAEALEKNADWDALPKALRDRCTSAAWHSAGRMAMARDARAARRFFERALQYRAFAPWTLAWWLFASARSAALKPH